MIRVVAFVVEVQVEDNRDQLTRQTAKAEGRAFLDAMLGTYAGTGKFSRNSINSSVGYSFAKRVRLAKPGA